MRRTWGSAALAWLVSRAVVLGAAVSAARQRGHDLTDVLTTWDGTWYLLASRHGYPSHVPIVHGRAQQSTIAFFPGYPLLIRWADLVLPGGDLVAAIVVNTVLGLAATVAFAALVERHWGAAAGRRGAWVFATFPGAIVLSMAYSEGLMLAAAICCLILLSRKRWVLAGLAGAVATVSRPTGLAVAAACAWVAVDVLRRRRDVRPLVAPALSVCGIGGFFVYLWHRTGHLDAWFRVEREGWGQHNDLGQSMIRQVLDVASGRARTIDDVVLAFGAVLTIALLVWLVRLRPPAAILVAGVVGAAFVVTGMLGARPRLVLGAFPLLIPPAVRLRDRGLAVWVALSLVGSFTLFWHLDANFWSGHAVLLSP